MANGKQMENKKAKDPVQDTIMTDKNTPPTIYDILRNKARDMEHPAANLPNELWNKYSHKFYKRDLLKDSKLMITDYMMGRLSPADLAEVMAEDNALRYTISDICRVRLEPADIDIQHNGKYIDLAAGAKTFWSEMRVPIPSEVDAARDLRNIYFGIEAGRASVETSQEKQDNETVKPESKKKSIRETIHDMKQKAAQKGIDILTPIADDKKQENSEVDGFEQFMANLNPEQMDQAYQNLVIDQRAKEIENLTMSVEASKDNSLEKSERVRALTSTGMSEEKANEFVQNKPEQSTEIKTDFTKEELNSTMNDEIAEILDQIQLHASRDLKGYNKQAATQEQSDDKQQAPKEKRLRKGYVNGEFEGKQVRFKGSWSTHKFSEDEVQKLLAGETISFTYTNKDDEEKLVSGKLEYQNHNGRDFFGFKANFGEKAIEATKEIVNKGDDSLFNAQDEALAMGYEESEQPEISTEDIYKLFEAPDPAADMAAYEEMRASGEIQEEPVNLTDADVSSIQDEQLPFSK